MKKDQRGQSLVETALILPIFLLVLCGILDFGRVIYSYSHLHMAAQEAVRLSGLGRTDAEVEVFAQDYVGLEPKTNLVVDFSPKITVDYPKRKSGEYVTVKLSYSYQFLTPLISKFFSTGFMIESDSTIRVE